MIYEKTVNGCRDDNETSIDEPSIDNEPTESKISIYEALEEVLEDDEELEEVLEEVLVIEEELENVLEVEEELEVMKVDDNKSETMKICTFCLRVFPETSSSITLIYDENNKESSHILIEKINKVLFENVRMRQ